MTILIADSSENIIDRLESLLLETNPKAIIFRATSYKDARIIFKKFEPTVVLLDMNLTGNMTITFLKEIKEPVHKTCVIILSSVMDNNIMQLCKLHGADFFLDKYHEFEKIPDIIKTCAANKIIQHTK